MRLHCPLDTRCEIRTLRYSGEPAIVTIILRAKQALMIALWIIVIIIGLTHAESGLGKEENEQPKK